MFSSLSEALSRLLPGPAVPGFQKVKDMMVCFDERPAQFPIAADCSREELG